MEVMEVLLFKEVSKDYASANATALKEVSFSVKQGEFTALAGPSGSGKSTILNLAAGLDIPSQGKVILLDKDLTSMDGNALTILRRNSVGFVFQSYNLFPVLTALENVEYQLALKGVSQNKRRRLAEAALEEVGMKGFGKRFPAQLSGGQQQRVAIARAIVSDPKIVFADEPTANLDSTTAEKLLLLFRTLNETKKITFLFSSHDPMVLRIADRILEICDGRIKADTLRQKQPTEAPLPNPVVRLPMVLPPQRRAA